MMLHKSIEIRPLSSPTLNGRTMRDLLFAKCSVSSSCYKILPNKFSSLFLSRSYDKNALKALIGSVMHLKPIILSLLPFLRTDPHYLCFFFQVV